MRVLLVGDSHAVGLKPYLEHYLRQQGHSLDALVRVGIATPKLVDLWNRDVVRAADAVVVASGTNDSGYRERPVAYDGAVRAVLDAYAAPGKYFAWWGPPVLSRPDLVELPSFVLLHVKPRVDFLRGFYLDSRELTSSLSWRRPDGVHLTPTGYMKWAVSGWDLTWRAFAGQLRSSPVAPTRRRISGVGVLLGLAGLGLVLALTR